ncbi:MAG: Gfo/Idh/MocA family oxidoreductase [Rubripirellula sp.]|nr:Gfo/Idh/MocA family oxidoreductase [Rubripirellula sp.]
MSELTLNRRTLLSSAAVTAGCLANGLHAAEGNQQKIRIGQIGVGHAHAAKLSVYRNSADYEVVGIVEPDPVRRKQAQSHAAFRDLPWMTQEQLLNHPGLQAVLVETPVCDSLNAAESCVAAGMHVHLDKPAGESLPQFERILNAARRQQLLIQMGYMYRYNPAIVMMRSFLQRGWLGDVFEIHTVMSKVVDPKSRRSLAEYRGGIMFELGCHILDLAIGVLGEPTSVNSFHQHASRQDDSLQDNMLAVLQYPKAIASVKSSALEVQGFSRRHFVVCGTKGTFHIQPLDNPSARVALTEPQAGYQAGYQEISFPKYTRYSDDANDMARILRGEKETDFPYEHDLAVQRTLLKACGLALS